MSSAVRDRGRTACARRPGEIHVRAALERRFTSYISPNDDSPNGPVRAPPAIGLRHDRSLSIQHRFGRRPSSICSPEFMAQSSLVTLG